MALFFWFDLFLETRSKWWHQKDILELTDLYQGHYLFFQADPQDPMFSSGQILFLCSVGEKFVVTSLSDSIIRITFNVKSFCPLVNTEQNVLWYRITSSEDVVSSYFRVLPLCFFYPKAHNGVQNLSEVSSHQFFHESWIYKVEVFKIDKNAAIAVFLTKKGDTLQPLKNNKKKIVDS